MPLPKLLIIGAMKAGTTGLYMDLATHPQVFLGHDKEPHALCHDSVLTPRGVDDFAAIYAKATPDQICIDASTGYSKRPDFEGVVDRALQVLPADFKVVYVVRHPIERIISQHHHEYFEGKVGPSIDDEVRRHPRYVHYSRYSYQLAPWLAAIGASRIRVVRFEDYVKRRQDTARDLCGFLGLPPAGCAVEEERVYNKSQGKPVKNRFWHRVQHNAAYRKLLRPLAPPKVRLALRRLLFPKASASLAPPRPDTLAYLREALSNDVYQLSEQLGREELFWPDFKGDAETVAPAPTLSDLS
jgi:Sulfotransferase family